MGYIAENYLKSQFALGIVPFMDTFQRPAFLSPKDLPYLPPPYQSVLEKVNAIVELDKARVADSYDTNFADRTQSGAPAWAGPPGFPETRPITVRPEQDGGTIMSWVA